MVIQQNPPEEDNVLPFERPIPKTNWKNPPPLDWLAAIKSGTRFLARQKGVVFLCGEFLHSGRQGRAVLLCEINTETRENRMFFVDSEMFSQSMVLVEILQEEEEINGENPPSPSGDGD